MPRSTFACFLILLSGCAASRQARYAPLPAPTAPATGVVFVANGAGDSRTASQRLAALVAETRAPLHIETFAWSHGYRRTFADQMDGDNHALAGRRLAEPVSAYRRAFPDRRICLVGQSAGGAVVLSAAECLPPNTVDRVVLLSPSVSEHYNLRPVLLASREGIDHFHSKRDRWILGLGMRIVGTTDGDRQPAAGKNGFRPMLRHPEDAILYTRLRQHPWHAGLRVTGHYGNHFGNLEPEFLRMHVLPMLAGDGRQMLAAR